MFETLTKKVKTFFGNFFGAFEKWDKFLELVIVLTKTINEDVVSWREI